MSMLDTPDAEARIIFGIITGRGFLDGAILKVKKNVCGTATVDSIWII
jgi:uncharacterized membrane protein YhiD involved in acid resistance